MPIHDKADVEVTSHRTEQSTHHTSNNNARSGDAIRRIPSPPTILGAVNDLISSPIPRAQTISATQPSSNKNSNHTYMDMFSPVKDATGKESNQSDTMNVDVELVGK
jgi:hypothetical protein